MTNSATAPAVQVVDPPWRGLYRAGGILAFGYVLLGIIVPALMYLPVGYPTSALVVT